MTHRGPAVAIIVAAAALIAYAASLPGTFQYDDAPTIVDNAAVRDVNQVPGYFTDPALFSGVKGNRMYRPVLLLTYCANHAVSDHVGVMATCRPTFDSSVSASSDAESLRSPGRCCLRARQSQCVTRWWTHHWTWRGRGGGGLL